MVRVIRFGQNTSPDEIVINTTSCSTNWSRGLSPFFIGPCELYDGLIAKNMENAWQFAKVYPEHVDENNDPTLEYHIWALKGWNDEHAHRYPMGKGAIPLYSYWDGEKLGYIEARKKIYIPLYQAAVMDTPAFKKLAETYLKHGKVTLVDYDGYDYLKLGITLEEVENNPKRKMGHAFVLAKMLKELK